jgi:uncharacterized protein
MMYLLDVNALLAYHYATHVHHARVRNWIYRQQDEIGRRNVTLATCAITELGFVRIAGQKAAALAESVIAARADRGSMPHVLPLWMRAFPAPS